MKIFYIVLGCLALALGCIGVALPILPTTPFLLLASFCFAKSSQRLSNWFQSTTLYKKNLESFHKGEGMTMKTKVRILACVTLLLLVAAVAMQNVTHGLLILGAVWIAHLIGFGCFIKTKQEEPTQHD